MKYRIDYQLTNDIDWFAEYNGIPLHFASNGHVIPAVIDSKNNRNIQRKIAEWSNIKRINIDSLINKKIRNLLTSDDNLDDYIASFVSFAKMGFVSLDTLCNNENNKNSRYIIVAYPSNRNNTLNMVFPEFYDMLQMPKLSDDIFDMSYLTSLWNKQ